MDVDFTINQKGLLIGKTTSVSIKIVNDIKEYVCLGLDSNLDFENIRWYGVDAYPFCHMQSNTIVSHLFGVYDFG